MKSTTRKAGDRSLHIRIGGNDIYIDIDRAIEALKGCTNETDRRIAEWLKELKRRRDLDGELIGSGALKNAYQQGYNKAIDDFANVLKENYDYLPQILSQEAFGRYIDEYEERLKEGVGNGTDNQ